MKMDNLERADSLARELRHIDKAISRLSKHPKRPEVKIGVPAVAGAMGHEYLLNVYVTPSAEDVVDFLYNRRTELVVELGRMGVEVDESS